MIPAQAFTEEFSEKLSRAMAHFLQHAEDEESTVSFHTAKLEATE